MKSRLVSIFLCIVYLQVCDSSTLKRRFDKLSYFKDLFCSGDEECGEQGCCKGIVCMDYLEEGEKCLLKHKLKVGCGCRPGLECTFKRWDLFVCVDSRETNTVEAITAREHYKNTDLNDRFDERETRENNMADEHENFEKLFQTNKRDTRFENLMEEEGKH